jgi:phage-related minor tail protein
VIRAAAIAILLVAAICYLAWRTSVEGLVEAKSTEEKKQMANKFFTKLETIGTDVKNFILKVAGDAPAVLQTVVNDEQEIAPVLEAFVPKSTTVVNTAMNIANLVADAVEAAGPAASANGLSVSLDQATVASVQAIIDAAKAAVSKSAPATPAAPANPPVAGSTSPAPSASAAGTNWPAAES